MRQSNRKLQAESILFDSVLPSLEEILGEIKKREQGPSIQVMTEEDVRCLARYCLQKAPEPKLSAEDRERLDFLKDITEHLKPRRPFILFDSRWGLASAILGMLAITVLFGWIICSGNTSQAMACEYYEIAVERGDEFPGDSFHSAYQMAKAGQIKELMQMIQHEKAELKNISYCRAVISKELPIDEILAVRHHNNYISCHFLSEGKEAFALLFKTGEWEVCFDSTVAKSSNPDRYRDVPKIKWLKYDATKQPNN